jgi:hypothetical protein
MSELKVSTMSPVQTVNHVSGPTEASTFFATWLESSDVPRNDGTHMGMIKCPIHGLTHITTGCIHIGEAVDAKQFERAYVMVDGLNTHHVLCERCLEKAAKQIHVSPSPSYLELDPPLEPHCHQHFLDWYAATGQGDLSDEIARARARSKA